MPTPAQILAHERATFVARIQIDTLEMLADSLIGEGNPESIINNLPPTHGKEGAELAKTAYTAALFAAADLALSAADALRKRFPGVDQK
jgi:hypothetical protein